MAVTQTTILAAGTTAANSAPVDVDAGVEVVVGVFTDGADAGDQNLPADVSYAVCSDTPGDDMTMFRLDKQNTAYRLRGPIKAIIKRPALPEGSPNVGFYKNV